RRKGRARGGGRRHARWGPEDVRGGAPHRPATQGERLHASRRPDFSALHHPRGAGGAARHLRATPSVRERLLLGESCPRLRVGPDPGGGGGWGGVCGGG